MFCFVRHCVRDKKHTKDATTVTTDGLTVMTVSHAAVTNAYAYDALRRQVFATDGRGNTRATLYNALGQVAATADYLGDPQLLSINHSLLTNLTSYAYDAAGRRISVTDPLGQTVHTAYDPRARRHLGRPIPWPTSTTPTAA